MNKYKLILNDKQMKVVKDALELRFRIDLCQGHELAEILSTMNNLDLSSKNPDHEKIFDRYLERREHINAILDAAFTIACPMNLRYSELYERDKDSLIAEDIWQCMRYALWQDNPNKGRYGYVVDSVPPLRRGEEPLPVVESINGRPGENE